MRVADDGGHVAPALPGFYAPSVCGRRWLNKKKPGFRGGKAAQRDRWFGLRGRPGFAQFREWWHREKNFSGRNGRDLMSKAEAEAA